VDPAAGLFAALFAGLVAGTAGLAAPRLAARGAAWPIRAAAMIMDPIVVVVIVNFVVDTNKGNSWATRQVCTGGQTARVGQAGRAASKWPP
jgi:hypothetical protein